MMAVPVEMRALAGLVEPVGLEALGLRRRMEETADPAAMPDWLELVRQAWLAWMERPRSAMAEPVGSAERRPMAEVTDFLVLLDRRRLAARAEPVARAATDLMPPR